jgi:hypoxanthine phosphoribosyltransferase
MKDDIKYVLADENKIAQTCDRLAEQIDADHPDQDRELVFVIVLKGSVLFATDLIRRINRPCTMEFMKVSSYGAGVETSGFIEVSLDLKRDIKDVDVIIIEDIIDSGRTLQKLCSLLENRGAHSVKCCTLLDKPSRRQVEMVADYTGIVIPDEFVVGYGLDFAEYYRNLPYIGVLDPSVYSE